MLVATLHCSNSACANESHAHHHGLNDSIWQQYKAVRRTFNTCLLWGKYMPSNISPVLGL